MPNHKPCKREGLAVCYEHEAQEWPPQCPFCNAPGTERVELTFAHDPLPFIPVGGIVRHYLFQRRAQVVARTCQRHADAGKSGRWFLGLGTAHFILGVGALCAKAGDWLLLFGLYGLAGGVVFIVLGLRLRSPITVRRTMEGALLVGPISDALLAKLHEWQDESGDRWGR